MHLGELTRGELVGYVCAQLAHFFPDKPADYCRAAIDAHLDAALERTGRCIDGVRMWPAGRFSHLHSTQYCLFLYYLANTVWRMSGEPAVPTRLFLLNKALNGIDLFYEIAMPEVFFIGHSVGIVLAKATYGEYLVLYQNSTVGKNHGIAPVIGRGVVMYPNTAIIGRAHIGDGAVLAQGTSVVNRDLRGNAMAFNGPDGVPVEKPLKRPILDDFFRLGNERQE